MSKIGKTECSFNVCGDGVFEPAMGESCDDGDLTFGDGCDQNCNVEPYYECIGGAFSTQTCAIDCGDG